MAKAKYRTREYLTARRNLEDRMRHDGHLVCAEPVCKKPTRVIHPGEPWHVCHDPTGTTILGPGHAACNTSEGATRGNATRRRSPRRWNL